MNWLPRWSKAIEGRVIFSLYIWFFYYSVEFTTSLCLLLHWRRWERKRSDFSPYFVVHYRVRWRTSLGIASHTIRVQYTQTATIPLRSLTNRHTGSRILCYHTTAYRKSNRALTYRKSRGVRNEWKWVAWKEKMTTWTFHVLKAWNGRKSVVRIL